MMAGEKGIYIVMTINEKANAELDRARKALSKALYILSEEQAYNNRNDVFHASTVNDVNRIVTAIEMLRD